MLRTKNQRKLVKLCRKDRKFFDAKPIKKKKAFKAFGMVILVMMVLSALAFQYQNTYQKGAGVDDFSVVPKEEVRHLKKASESKKNAFLSLSQSKSWVGHVQEREIKSTPYAAVKFKGTYYEISKDGKMMKEQSEDHWGLLPIVSGAWSEKHSDISDIHSSDLVKSGMSLILNMEHSGLSPQRLSEVYHDAQMGWVAYFQNPRVNVVFGKENFFGKSERLIKIFKKFERRSDFIKTIDLDFNEMAVVKFNKNSGEENGQS